MPSDLIGNVEEYDNNIQLEIDSLFESIQCSLKESFLDELYFMGIRDMDFTLTVNGSIEMEENCSDELLDNKSPCCKY